MLTFPDFSQKRIVIVGNNGNVTSNLKFYNSNIRLYYGEKFIDQVSCYSVICLFIVGDTTLTTKLIKKAKEYGISIFLLSNNLKNYAEIFSSAEGNYKLRQKQYQTSEQSELVLSRLIVKNKIKNQLLLLQEKNINEFNKKFNSILENIDSVDDRQLLLGIEGNTSSLYFGAIYKDHDWHRRAPQAKEDPLNLLLDVGYTLIFNYIDSVLHLFGFDTYKGFYHKLFFERRSLSCDMMEPLRPIIDRQILKMFNLKQINEKDFYLKDCSYSFKDFESANKYSNHILEAVLKQKEPIYDFVYSFYRHIQEPEKHNFIEFSPL
ncbi:MAG: CRISPR-associated endonuclease Cas1 [Candidatus Shapirobacteria bacterium]|nr:CRISPR-associated endonuclease Cas1 [Candidatus Shapirobacteria bacterium]